MKTSIEIIISNCQFNQTCVIILNVYQKHNFRKIFFINYHFYSLIIWLLIYEYLKAFLLD